MKRILSIVCVVVMATSMWADAYRDALMKYLQFNSNEQQELLNAISAQITTDPNSQGAKALTEYMSTQMITDIADIYEPSFRKHVSIEDLQQLEQQYSDPRFADITKRSAAVIANMAQSTEYMAFIRQFQSSLMAMATGQGLPQDLPIPDTISGPYVQAFQQYYQQARVEEATMASFRNMTPMLTSSLRSAGVTNAEEMVSNLIAYTQRNIPTVILTLMNKTMTLDDMQLMNSVTSTPAYQHVMDASIEVTGNPIAMAKTLLGKMVSWMETNHPDHVAPYKQLLQTFEMMR